MGNSFGSNFPNQGFNNPSFSRNGYTINAAESHGYTRTESRNNQNFSRGNYSANIQGSTPIASNTNPDSNPQQVFVSLDGRKWSTRDQQIRANHDYYRNNLGKK